MVRITESCVLKTRVVNRSYLIEQVKRDLSRSYRLLLRIYQVFNAQQVGLVKVHHSDVVKATEHVILNLVFHEGDSRVEGIVPCQVKIINYGSEVFVPVQMFGESECVFGVHFDCWDVLVEDIDCNVSGKFEAANFVSELIDFSQIVSERHRHLG